MAWEVRRAFTVFQLMTILGEARHGLVIVKHDPLLYEDAAEMIGYVSHALSDAAKEAAALLYSPGLDPFLGELAKNADSRLLFQGTDDFQGASEDTKGADNAGGILMGRIEFCQLSVLPISIPAAPSRSGSQVRPRRSRATGRQASKRSSHRCQAFAPPALQG